MSSSCLFFHVCFHVLGQKATSPSLEGVALCRNVPSMNCVPGSVRWLAGDVMGLGWGSLSTDSGCQGTLCRVRPNGTAGDRWAWARESWGAPCRVSWSRHRPGVLCAGAFLEGCLGLEQGHPGGTAGTWQEPARVGGDGGLLGRKPGVSVGTTDTRGHSGDI